MKIALLGAPGAGKTKIARRLARRLNTDKKSWTVIDGYVDRLTARTGVPFGPDQTVWAFRYNLQIWGERWTLEDEAQFRDLNSITCGTIFESIIYAAAQSMGLSAISDEALMLAETHVAEIMMRSLNILTSRTYDYDAIFYLPLDNPEHDWNSVIDAKLPEVLEGQFKVAVPLTGTDRQKVNRAEEVIREISAFAENDEHPV